MRIQKNLERRFGNPLRVKIVISGNRGLGSAEARYQQGKIFSAYSALLRDLMGREPTEKELFGPVEIKSEVVSNV